MLRRTLNLGILAHVDAGKTTLTERLLYAAGVIDEIGSVDKGTTQTDSLALEQQRGITIKSAVVSFEIDDMTVNLIDTPGHPDFIAEVERVLGVLDGAVLVISAVEGVQPQTRILMRALAAAADPDAVFVNKIDRVGADVARVVGEIDRKLTPAVVAMTSATGEGTRARRRRGTGRRRLQGRRWSRSSAEHDDTLLAAYLDDGTGCPRDRLARRSPRRRGRRSCIPVFCGSAITGAGVDLLMAAIAELLPAAARRSRRRGRRTVFKIERGPAGDRIAYVRMFSGTAPDAGRACASDATHEAKVTAISVFERGDAVRRPSVAAGAIAKVWGLAEVQIGDAIGDAPGRASCARVPAADAGVGRRPGRRRGERQRLRAALAQLAEQDPLIDVRQDDRRQEISVSLYGEVQKEVIQATLAADYGIAVAVPRDDADLRRAADRQRRGRRDPPRGDEPVPRDDRAPRRAVRPRARASTSASTSTRAPFRSTSTRRSRASPRTWTSTCATRCARGSSAGRSRTAS